MSADLDRIRARVREASPFNVSPRGISLRSDAELDSLLDGLGPDDLAAVDARLGAEESPFAVLAWLTALIRIGTPEARGAIDRYVERLRAEDPWPGKFPGRREVLLYLGHDS